MPVNTLESSTTSQLYFLLFVMCLGAAVFVGVLFGWPLTVIPRLEKMGRPYELSFTWTGVKVRVEGNPPPTDLDPAGADAGTPACAPIAVIRLRSRLDMQHPCLICGAPWEIAEQAVNIVEYATPVTWVPISDNCAARCLEIGRSDLHRSNAAPSAMPARASTAGWRITR